MELLRLLAMFLVMTDHAGFMALGVPSQTQVVSHAFLSAFTYTDMAFSIVCVNTFVLISGWFGIKWKPKRIGAMIVQVVFFSTGVFLVLCLINPHRWLTPDNIGTLLLLHGNDYWFIKSYIFLFLLAPMLNRFFEESSPRAIGLFLIIFYAIQTVYGWLSINGVNDFCGGYSVLSFIGLYMLARYIRIYGSHTRILQLSSKTYFLIFAALALLQATVAFWVTYFGFHVAGRLFTYTNPVVIAQSVCLVLAFARMRVFHNRVINYIASSSLAVYLLHGNELIMRTFYAPFIKGIFTAHGLVLAILLTFCFIITVYILSIGIDKLRILTTHSVLRLIRHK